MVAAWRFTEERPHTAIPLSVGAIREGVRTLGPPLGERARPDGLPLRVGFAPSGCARGLRGSGWGHGGQDGHAHQRQKARGKGGEEPPAGGRTGEGAASPCPRTAEGAHGERGEP